VRQDDRGSLPAAECHGKQWKILSSSDTALFDCCSVQTIGEQGKRWRH
jgi:hypothetical protein